MPAHSYLRLVFTIAATFIAVLAVTINGHAFWWSAQKPLPASEIPEELKGRRLFKICADTYSESFAIDLNSNEKILICGSDKADGYENIPHLQKIQNLKTLLQNRGYASAEFEVIGPFLLIHRNSIAKVNSLVFVSPPSEFHPEYKRKVIDETLDSSKLDEVESWSKSRLGHIGYPCHTVKIQALLPERDLQVTLTPGVFQRVKSVQREGLDILNEKAILRQEAFKVGWEYDAELVELSNQRLLRDGLVQSSYYGVECGPEGATLTHHISIGQPRLLRFGIGASTEELPFIDVLWKNQRLDAFGSQLGLSTHASNRIQNIQFFSEFYLFQKARDLSLNPRFEVERKNEVAYETLSAKSGADLGYRKELRNFRLVGTAGPTINYQNTVRGQGPDDAKYLTWQAQLNLFTHSFEFYQVQQITGTNLTFQFLTQRKGVGSNFNATHYLVQGKTLFNFKHFHPALWVNGFRWQVNSTITDNQSVSSGLSDLPNEYRSFLGGVDTLRGFGRKSINNSDFGYLTSAYVGYETRLVETLPYQIQPLLLFDYAKVGTRSLTLDAEAFISYGAGLRWMSPFGPLRFVAARGEILNSRTQSESAPHQWAYTASFGQEF